MLSLLESKKDVGIAYANSVERKIGVSEFVETDIFSNTEVCPLLRRRYRKDTAICKVLKLLLGCKQSLLIQLGIKEVIYPTEDKTAEAEGAKLKKLIERCNIIHSERKKCQSSSVFPGFS